MKIHRNFMAAGVLSIAALGLTACGGSTDTGASPDPDVSLDPDDEALVLVVDACDAVDEANENLSRDKDILWEELVADGEANNYSVTLRLRQAYERTKTRAMWKDTFYEPALDGAAAVAVEAAYLDRSWERFESAAIGIATEENAVQAIEYWDKWNIQCDAARAIAERG